MDVSTQKGRDAVLDSYEPGGQHYAVLRDAFRRIDELEAGAMEGHSNTNAEGIGAVAFGLCLSWDYSGPWRLYADEGSGGAVATGSALSWEAAQLAASPYLPAQPNDGLQLSLEGD